MDIICKKLRSVKKYGFVFLFGSFCYGALEIAWRGYTHPAMLILGGLCLLMIYFSEERFGKNFYAFPRAAIYALMITFFEFLCGLVLNLGLGLDIWDYTPLPFNLMGQICVRFSILWFLLSAFCIYLCKALRFLFGT